MTESDAPVALDVHEDVIARAVAMPGREAPVYRGENDNGRKSLLRLIRSPSSHGEPSSFCCEKRERVPAHGQQRTVESTVSEPQAATRYVVRVPRYRWRVRSTGAPVQVHRKAWSGVAPPMQSSA